jgi:hypothetical protein
VALREDIAWGLLPQVYSWKKDPGSEPQEVWRQDEMIGGKPPVVT